MLLEHLREQVVQVGLDALARGIVHGTAGNMSIRDLETGSSPSRRAEFLSIHDPADVVVVTDRGEVGWRSEAELRNTAAHMVMHARPDIEAIVHTHSHYATVVSCIRPTCRRS